ncbi:O-antigen ligase family protein [Devosia sp. A369]
MLNSLSSIMLVSGLAFMGTAPFVADYIVLAAGLFGLGLALVSRDAVLKTWPARLPLLALVLIALTIPFVYKSELDLLPLAVFSAFLLAPGVAVLIQRSPEWLSPYAFALACLTGAVTACLMGLAETASIEGMRVGVGNNPIHYGGIAAVLGFMALTGVVAGRSPMRLLFLIGPLAGLVAVLLSGSRGPLLAWFATAAVAVPFLVWWNRRDWLTLVGVAIILAAAVGLTTLSPDNRATTMLFDAAELADHEIAQAAAGLPPEQVPDASELSVLIAQTPVAQAIREQDSIRLAMLNSALAAFKSSPIVGIGLGQIMPFANQLYPGMAGLAELDNYHNDLANFAAMAGLFGILAYCFVMLSPLVLLWPAAARKNHALVLGSIMLVVSYGVLGLTNAMFGILPQTMLFVLVLGYLMALQRATLASQP